MADTLAKLGFGTLLKVAGVTLLENVEITGPEETSELVEATHHQSPSGYREKLPSLKDGGEASGTGNLVLDTTQTDLRDRLVNQTKTAFQIVVPVSGTAKTYGFDGYVTRFAPSYPLDDRMQYEFAITITGAVTLT